MQPSGPGRDDTRSHLAHRQARPHRDCADQDAGGLEDRVPFLARLEAADRSALHCLGTEMRFAPRMVLLRQNEPSSHVLILLHGWTKVTATAANGYEALLALRGPGDIVGEHAVLTGSPRSATVTALEHVTAMAIGAERFREFLYHSPQVFLVLGGLVSDRRRAGDRQRVRSASQGVRERLAALLLDLARTHGKRTAEGIKLSVPLSKQELAGSVGASRETVQRLLKELRDRGVVSTGRRTMLIMRLDILRRIARTGA